MSTSSERQSRLPGPRRLAGLRRLWELSRDPLSAYAALAREYGPVARFNVGPKQFVLVSGPELAFEILQRDLDGWVKGFGNDVLRPLIGRGLFLAEGAAWRRRRQQLRPLFLRERVAAMAPLIADTVARAIDDLVNEASQGPLDLHARVRVLTLRILSKGLIGVDLCAIDPEIPDALERLWRTLRACLSRGGTWSLRVPTATSRRFAVDLARVERVALQAIREHRGDAVLDLVGALGADGADPSSTELRDEILTFLLAGQECTSIAVAWAAQLLGPNPVWSRALSRAADATVARQVLKESVRLYPPAWMISRDNPAPVQIGGFEIPARTTVLICTYNLHRDPALWPEPELFDPGRFGSDGRSGGAARAPHAYLPFGAGPRTCIGSTLALTIGERVLDAIYKRFVVTPVARHVEPDPGLTLRPRGGVWARLCPAPSGLSVR